ncbi:hypothetical protein BDW42DRAFT_149935 [Aspergillus taichungensis]|uniref:Uncharacterized protein n=1 Tax=Aspergillus taichungensis TaxID=482145 RepID=A0A2J5I6D9_9EURO|nr:hypothetical protein BDW42DRAFT_149935 [Aspergillus taichungensis]
MPSQGREKVRLPLGQFSNRARTSRGPTPAVQLALQGLGVWVVHLVSEKNFMARPGPNSSSCGRCVSRPESCQADIANGMDLYVFKQVVEIGLSRTLLPMSHIYYLNGQLTW